MGEIANQHVEAWAAGLDPNEMDGADWAAFWESENGPLNETDEDAAEDLSAAMRVWVCQILIDRGEEGDTLATIMRRLFPKLSQGQAEGFEALLQAIDGLPHDDD